MHKTQQAEAGSPKASDLWPIVALSRKRPNDIEANFDVFPADLPPIEEESETYIPVSALLSDEVVEAAAKGNYEANRVEMHGPRRNPEWDNTFEPMKEVGRNHARRILQAAVDHLGGTDAH
jgi:hypothetical protein